jgi:hypothetical protein
MPGSGFWISAVRNSGAGGIGDSLGGIGNIGKHPRNEREPAARCSQQWHGAIAIRHVGRTDLQFCNPLPSASTKACRLRPLTFFAAS